MATWSSFKSRITASVRTTNRMNALLSDTMVTKRRALIKLLPPEPDSDAEDDKLKNELKFFHRNFCMERVYNIIENSIEERITCDRFSRVYDSWRSLQLAESLAAEIRNRVKELRFKRHRIICIVTLVERQCQGLNVSMRYLLDEKLDNYTKFVYERPTYFIVVTVFLVHQA